MKLQIISKLKEDINSQKDAQKNSKDGETVYEDLPTGRIMGDNYDPCFHCIY